MAINWARSGVFAAGVVLGAIGAAALFGPGGDEPRQAAPVALPALPSVPAGAADCASYQPLLPSAGEGDGQRTLEKDVQASSSTVHDLIVQGKEDAAAGRARDAEAAFLVACRGAARLDGDPVPLADAQYQLGRHYAQVAASPQAARRDELVKRAQALYVTALTTFRQHRGPDHEKTRFAAEGLASLQQRMAGAGTPMVASAAPAAERKEEAAAKEAAAKEAAAKEAAAKEAAAKEAAAKEAAAKEAAAKEAAAKEAAAKEAAAKEAAAKEAAAKEAAAKEAAAKEAAAKEAAAKEAAAKEAAAKEAAAKEAAAKEAAAKEAAAKEAAAKEAAAKQAAAKDARERAETRTAAADPKPERTASRRRTEPSFDCDLARSTTERLICADDDLARQDRELGRLFQRAKQAAPDPRAFQRQSDAAWQRREDTCRDRACLQRWYAQRRAELSASLATPSTPAVVAGSATGDAGQGEAIPQAEGSAGAD